MSPNELLFGPAVHQGDYKKRNVEGIEKTYDLEKC